MVEHFLHVYNIYNICTRYTVCVCVCVCYIILRVTERQPVRDASSQVAIKRVLLMYLYCLRQWPRVVGIIYATNLVDRINITPQVNSKTVFGFTV